MLKNWANRSIDRSFSLIRPLCLKEPDLIDLYNTDIIQIKMINV